MEVVSNSVMQIVGPILAVAVIVLVAVLLLRQYYPHAVLLVAGLFMLVTGYLLDFDLPAVKESTGWFGFDLFRYIKESFSKNLARVGLMIMAIGGFVAYMEKIGASHALVRVAMRPLQWFRQYPYASASLLIPIGQLLFVCIPSAAGLGLLLMASVFPLIVGLGVSRLSAVSVVVACTSFGIGPASAITARATEILETPTIDFFFSEQLPLVLPMSLLMAVTFFFVNRHYDRRDGLVSDGKEEEDDREAGPEDGDAPAYYALFPIMPLVLLLVFSSLLDLFSSPIRLDTTTAMLVSTAFAIVIDGIRKADLQESFDSLKVFWSGMANIFKSVVTLIIAADIFSKGLIGLGFIDGLLAATEGLGFAALGIGVVTTVLIFAASMLMGSGNASFFAFGPLVPNVAAKLNIDATYLILPMQLSASMGRAVSPISGVVIATAAIAKVSNIDIAKRNFIPLVISLIFMLVYHNTVG